MKKLLIILVFVVMFLSMLSGAGTIGPFKQGQNINLIQTCNDCTGNNITSLLLGDKTLLSLNLPMQADTSGTFYNYTLNSTYTQTLGTYEVCGVGDDSSGANWCYNFDVTSNGLAQSTSQGLGSAAFLFLMIVLMFVFGFVGFKLLKSKNLWILGIFFIFLSIIFLVYNTWLGYEYHRLFTGLPNSNIPMTLFYIFMLILVLGFLVSLALLFLNWKKVFRYIKNEIKRKESSKEEEDWDIDEWAGGNSFDYRR